jgi:phytoene/squalene synthetase
VGRLLLHLFGMTDARSLRESDAVCTALQLANFWQDVELDWAKGAGLHPARGSRALRRRRGGDRRTALRRKSWQRLMAFECERTRKLFDAGAPLGRRPSRPHRPGNPRDGRGGAAHSR